MNSENYLGILYPQFGHFVLLISIEVLDVPNHSEVKSVTREVGVWPVIWGRLAVQRRREDAPAETFLRPKINSGSCRAKHPVFQSLSAVSE